MSLTPDLNSGGGGLVESLITIGACDMFLWFWIMILLLSSVQAYEPPLSSSATSPVILRHLPRLLHLNHHYHHHRHPPPPPPSAPAPPSPPPPPPSPPISHLHNPLLHRNIPPVPPSQPLPISIPAFPALTHLHLLPYLLVLRLGTYDYSVWVLKPSLLLCTPVDRFGGKRLAYCDVGVAPPPLTEDYLESSLKLVDKDART
ncbi:hypothetical protein QVD17_20357 [Tagetes erecta]|uniref:Uncharacterized protein n=1 Tax=Tagetes erecta TaxID=13708 RepID=A0AAD8KL34_TARER|nr:hypothetical protein QVD17_20357 [Tagetes erecta]